MPLASLCEPPQCVGDNITKLLWWPSPILPHLCSLLYIFQGPPFPSKSTLFSPPFYLLSLSQRPFRPSPTLLSISLPCSCSHATLSSLFPFTLLCFPFHSISLPHPEGLRGLHLSALHPSFHPFPSTDLGQALRTPCAAQGYRKGRPLQRRNTERYSGSNASPPGAGGGEHILLLGRGSSLRVDSQKEALDQGSEDAEYPEPECWLPICSVTLGRRWSRLANFSRIAMQMQRAHVGDG